MDSTHPTLLTESDPPPTEPTSPTVGDGLLPPESDFDGSNVGSPSSKSDKSDPIDPQIFQRYLINLVSFRCFLARSSEISLDLVEFLARYPRDFSRSSWDLRYFRWNLKGFWLIFIFRRVLRFFWLDLGQSGEISLDLVEFLARSDEISPDLVEILAISCEILEDFRRFSSFSRWISSIF